jgi:MFS family permease
LIGFRVLQGISGGLMAPMAQLMLARFAGKHMVRILGYAAIPVLLGPILGPVLAGAILQHATWHWLFLINLPIGIVAVVLASLFIPDDNDNKETARGLDLIGFLLLSPGLELFLYGSDHLGEQPGFRRCCWRLFCWRLLLAKPGKTEKERLSICDSSGAERSPPPLSLSSRITVFHSRARC